MRYRIRTLKPEFFRDEKVQRLPLTARLLFIGLIVHADDEGRLDGSPQGIRSLVYPLDDISVKAIDKLLQQIAECGLVTRYNALGIDWIQITKWHSHQKINRPTPSRIPPANSLNGHGAITEDSVNDHGTFTTASRARPRIGSDLSTSSSNVVRGNTAREELAPLSASDFQLPERERPA